LKGKTLPLINADNTDREKRETFTKEGTDNRRHRKGKALPLINADNDRLASAT
jgi:hypothetical protein